jgi:hypothetical protein
MYCAIYFIVYKRNFKKNEKEMKETRDENELNINMECVFSY